MINRLQTAHQPVTKRLSTADFVTSFGLHRISLVRASRETFKRRVIDALEGTKEACLLGVLFCRRSVLLGPAPPPRRAPRPDPPVVCSGFGIDKFTKVPHIILYIILHNTCRIQNPSISRAGRFGAHGEAAGRGRAGLDAHRTGPGDMRPSYSPRHRRHVSCVIEHKRCPTGKISQQQNQSQNKPVQNANTSHAAEACRLRAARRAGCASEDAPGARRKTRRLRARRRAGCASQDAPVARRKTRRLRAGRRAVCRRAESAPRGVPVARRVRARARPFFFPWKRAEPRSCWPAEPAGD